MSRGSMHQRLRASPRRSPTSSAASASSFRRATSTSRHATEQRPDVVLVVLAPEGPGVELEKRVLYVPEMCAGTPAAVRWRRAAGGRALAERGVPWCQGGAGSRDPAGARDSTLRSARASASSIPAWPATTAAPRRPRRRSQAVPRHVRRSRSRPTSPGADRGVDDCRPATTSGREPDARSRAGSRSVNDALGGPGGHWVPVKLYLTRPSDSGCIEYFDNAQGELRRDSRRASSRASFRAGATTATVRC